MRLKAFKPLVLLLISLTNQLEILFTYSAFTVLTVPRSTINIRKQFHVLALAVFLPGVLCDLHMTLLAASCALIVFAALEVTQFKMLIIYSSGGSS